MHRFTRTTTKKNSWLVMMAKYRKRLNYKGGLSNNIIRPSRQSFIIVLYQEAIKWDSSALSVRCFKTTFFRFSNGFDRPWWPNHRMNGNAKLQATAKWRNHHYQNHLENCTEFFTFSKAKNFKPRKLVLFWIWEVLLCVILWQQDLYKKKVLL